ncbi:MAG: sulfite exporter TauE/SafE family protein [Nitrososphaera sp.]|nr:sulfite exporter TauE/SafE family protein [Nitrososphaera sp.]
MRPLEDEMGIHLIVGLILSASIGLSLGLIGGGGSIITVPVLVYVMDVEPYQAVAMSLAVVGVTSFIGAMFHYKRGTVDLKTGTLFGALGILGAYFGSHLTYLLSPSILLLSFAVLMLLIASLMLIRKQSDGGRTARQSPSALKAIVSGLIVGLLTGFLGVGGGFLIVPALVFFGGLSIRDAIGTSLMIITINCSAGFLGHLSHGGFDTRLMILVTALATAGTLIGTTLSHRASPALLRKWFAMFVIAVALFLVAKNYTALL